MKDWENFSASKNNSTTEFRHAAMRAKSPRGKQVRARVSLEAASILAFYMFFLALRGLSPYSSGRAWIAGLEAGRRA